jgi:hypothetical protein
LNPAVAPRAGDPKNCAPVPHAAPREVLRDPVALYESRACGARPRARFLVTSRFRLIGADKKAAGKHAGRKLGD